MAEILAPGKDWELLSEGHGFTEGPAVDKQGKALETREEITLPPTPGTSVQTTGDVKDQLTNDTFDPEAHKGLWIAADDLASAPLDQRDRATAVACALAWERGARIFRVHAVAAAREALALTRAVGAA